jgi:hypothetical protein
MEPGWKVREEAAERIKIVKVRRLKPDYSNNKPLSSEGKAAIAEYSNGCLERYR